MEMTENSLEHHEETRLRLENAHGLSTELCDWKHNLSRTKLKYQRLSPLGSALVRHLLLRRVTPSMGR